LAFVFLEQRGKRIEGATGDEEGGASPSPTERAWGGSFFGSEYITKEEAITVAPKTAQ